MARITRFFTTLFLSLASLSAIPSQSLAQEKLELSPGQSIALIGNTLADRMQHEGSLEAMIHAKFPQHDLTFRNLSVAGDELTERSRSENFGSPDDWLTKTKADVIFAFFGFNESFDGPDGVEKFKNDLRKFLQETKAKNYSGKGAPKIVLFSPIAHENLKSPDFPDGAEDNFRIKYYVDAMNEVAQSEKVQYVDLFAPSQQLYAAAAKPLTINGIHLTDEGNKALAPAAFQSLFGEAAPVVSEKLQQAVVEKNWQWHQRYRTVDGFNVYGGRSQLAFPQGEGKPDITNFLVMQEEMRQRDAKTANRDKRVWAVAKGGDLTVDDANLPPVTPVPTNKPGNKPDKSHDFVSGQDAIALMKVHPGCKVNLFADESQFPLLAKPVQMAWDTKGRLWVAAWPNYPGRTPTSTQGDSLLVFEDTNGDGKADKCTPFLEDLNCPTGFQFYKDGVLIMQAPDLWFVRDTDGDGRGDSKERLLMGMDSADSHHTTNAMCLDPGGATYLSDGVFHRTQVETLQGPVRNTDGGIYRFEPRTGKMEIYINYGFANPHGRVFDRWGNDLVTDATGNNTYFGPAISGKSDWGKHASVKEFWPRPMRPCPATAMVSSSHFPEDWHDVFLNLNVIGFQGIYRVKVKHDESGYWGESLADLITSTDPNFRPICISTGPDGALYFCDWHNPIIGHMQHHLRDPNRDHVHGRIYRITYEGRPLVQPAKIAGEPIEKLLENLKAYEDNVRERSKIELDTRDTREVIAAVKKWTTTLDPADKNYEHHMMEALWVHQWHNVVDVDLLKRMLKSPEPMARAAATRVLCYWRDRVPEAVTLLKEQAADPAPQVRLHAVRAASYFQGVPAVEAALSALKHPMDYYLEYTFGETLHQLEQYWKKALDEGVEIASDNPAAVQFLMKNVTTPQLLGMKRTPLVSSAIISREDVSQAERAGALLDLSTAKKSDLIAETLNTLESSQGVGQKPLQDMGRILAMQDAAELKKGLDRLRKLAASSASPPVREAALAGLVKATGDVEGPWTSASKNPAAMLDLLRAIPLVNDPAIRPLLHAKLRAFFHEMPPELTAALGKEKSLARFIRIEIPRNGTLTLAEVEVISDGKNIASRGKASQSSVGHGGEPQRAMDGNKSGSYSGGGQTHTNENETNPWWELDLQQESPVDAVEIWNRTEENYGARLEGFSLIAMDAQRNVVFRKDKVPAPAQSVRLPGSGDPLGSMTRAALQAIVSTGQEPEVVFAALTGMVAKNKEIVAAGQSIMQLPRGAWKAAGAAEAAESIIAWARAIPAEQRASQEVVETLQVASELAGLLAPDKATALRQSIRSVSVPVFVLKTVREKLRYDQARFVVEAGKDFQIIFENNDLMPHNLVVTTKDARNEIMIAALTMSPSGFDGQGRSYIPNDPRVIDATKMLEAGQTQTLKLKAPAEEGSLDFVCTFPSHGALMWGKIIVTKDPEAYLKAHQKPEELPPNFDVP